MMTEVRIDIETGCFIQSSVRLPSGDYCMAKVGNEVAAANNLSHWDDAGTLLMVASRAGDLEHLQVLVKRSKRGVPMYICQRTRGRAEFTSLNLFSSRLYCVRVPRDF